jgi:hypothetical protein
VGVTGLALLAFLGDGNTFTRGAHSRAVERGVGFLLDVQDPETGRFGLAKGNYMYGHAIATLALCEAYGMALTDPPASRVDLSPLAAGVRNAVVFLLQTQAPRGGWGYSARDRKSDTSVTAWPLAALASALRLKLVPTGRSGEVRRAVDGAAGWFRHVTHGTGAVGYRSPGSYKTGPHSLTAVSLYCRGLFAKNVTPRSGEIASKQIRIVASHAPTLGKKPDFYFWYYGAHGLRHTDREAYLGFNRPLVKVLEALQEKDGGFPRRSAYGDSGGRVYSTAMALLALEAPYRYPVR